MKLTPGSKEAVEKGCKCPIIDNYYGKGVEIEPGKFEWWIDAECPIHNTKLIR